MKRQYYIPLFFLAIFLCGCTVPRKLSREQGYIDCRNPSGELVPATDELSERVSGNTFNGKLKLLYEKKVNGAPISRIYVGDKLFGYLTTHRRFLFFLQKNGDRVCRIKKGKGYILNPVVTDSLLVLVKKFPLGQIWVRNIFTGKTIKTVTVKHISSGPILSNNRLIVGTAQGIVAFTFPELKQSWELPLESIADITPMAKENTVYFACGNGIIGAVESKSGNLLWQKQLDGSIVSELSIGQYIYVGLYDGSLLALDRNDGSQKWQVAIGSQFHGRATEAGNVLYFGGSNGKIYCVSAQTGQKQWAFPTKGVVMAQPIVLGKAVLVGSFDRYFYSLDAKTGALLDRKLLEGPVNYAAAVGDGRIFVACRKNRLYCFEDIK